MICKDPRLHLALILHPPRARVGRTTLIAPYPPVLMLVHWIQLCLSSATHYGVPSWLPCRDGQGGKGAENLPWSTQNRQGLPFLMSLLHLSFCSPA